MIFLRSKRAVGLVVIALALAAALMVIPRYKEAPVPQERAKLALMTSLPIYWNEAESLEEMLESASEPHWVRTALERDFELVPLNTLVGDEGLAGHRLLLLGQPRALSPEENVALDEWVRRGGQVVLIADPLLTGESRFHIGDRRRPQDVALLSPILARWGLELTFDELQPDETTVTLEDGTAVPVQFAGRWKHAGGQRYCRLGPDALVADCAIGEGKVLAVADAAFLDTGISGNTYPDVLFKYTTRFFDSP